MCRLEEWSRFFLSTLKTAPVNVPHQLLEAREGSPAPTGSTGETQVGVEGLHKKEEWRACTYTRLGRAAAVFRTQ